MHDMDDVEVLRKLKRADTLHVRYSRWWQISSLSEQNSQPAPPPPPPPPAARPPPRPAQWPSSSKRGMGSGDFEKGTMTPEKLENAVSGILEGAAGYFEKGTMTPEKLENAVSEILKKRLFGS